MNENVIGIVTGIIFFCGMFFAVWFAGIADDKTETKIRREKYKALSLLTGICWFCCTVAGAALCMAA